MQAETVILVVVVFLIAGGVKGVIGFGLPTVSITIIAVAVGLTEAMALMVLPSLVTNFWQGVTGASCVTCYVVSGSCSYWGRYVPGCHHLY